MTMKPSDNQKASSGVVLAGGRSSRFGQDKGLFTFHGKALAAHALDIIRPHCGELMISTNRPEDYARLLTPTVADIFPECGPMGGIHAALKKAGKNILVVIGCDMPLVPAQLIGHLLQEMKGHQVVIPVHEGFSETMCAVYAKECLPVIERTLTQKTFKILDVLEQLDTCFLEIDEQPFYRPGMFRNINYRKDTL